MAEDGPIQAGDGPGTDGGTGAEDWLAINRANWDERVPIHVSSQFYGVDAFRQGDEHLHGFELDEIGDVADKDLLHLQCHFGLDTISLARRGARVTGLDFSAPAVSEAKRLAAELGIEARFVEGNVYDARNVLTDDYDIVYTGKGALCWIPDLEEWAGVIASLLRPGGVLYLSEFHPLVWALDDEETTIRYPYFNEGPLVFDDGLDYASDARLQNARNVEWSHPLSEVVSSVLDAGLRLELLHEHTVCSYRRFPWLVETERRVFTTPPGTPELPFMYSLRAVKEL